MSDRYILNETRSPIDPSSWSELNENWELIKSYLRFLERQIKFLAGGSEIDDILLRIDTAIANAENATTDVEQARTEFNSILNDLNTLVTNAETATENANTAASNANELNTALNSLKSELETLQTNLNNIVQAESQRVSNEQNRVSAEQSRKNEETTRRENEAARVLKEQSRENAEQNRTTTFDAQMLTAEQKITMMQYLIDNLRSYDYNPSTTYNFPNLIKWNGSTFMALKEITGVTPVDDGINYRLVAQRGVDGTGAVSSVNGMGPDANGNIDIIMALVNNLVSDSTTAGLTAAQGKALKVLFDGLQQAFNTHNGSTDNPHQVTAEQLALGNVQNFSVATQPEAEAGTAADKYMTPVRTKQAINKSLIPLQEQVTQHLAEDISYNGTITPFRNQSTTLYVAPDNAVVTGNNGLSADKPIKLSDIEIIFNALKVKFPVLLGFWKIQLASGNYQGDGSKHMLYLANIESVELIEINGATVAISAIPITVLDGKINGSTYKHGIFVQNMNVKVSNIKFQNFTEGTDANIPTGTRAGLACSGEKGRMWAYNIHANNCSWGGLTNQGIPRLYVQGGLFENCRQGIVSMFNTQVSIGYGGSDIKPDNENTRLYNNIEVGILLQSQVSGHVDFCVFDRNSKGLTLVTSSEVNALKNKFTNNSTSISVQSNSRLLNSGNYFQGNTQQYDLFYGGYVQQTESSDANNRRREVAQLIDNENKYFVSTVPNGGGVMFSQSLVPSSIHGRGKTFELKAVGRVSNLGTNTSTFIIKVSDGTNTITLAEIPIPSTASWKPWKLEFDFSNYSQTNNTFTYSFFMEDIGHKVNFVQGVNIDTAKALTFSLELIVNGTPTNSGMNTVRIFPRVVF